MPGSNVPRPLAVPGLDPVELLGTESHQSGLVPLIDGELTDGTHDPATAPEPTAMLHPVLRGGAPRCEVQSGGCTIGELPLELSAEVHTGLLALAMLDPPYVVVVPVHLEWRERDGRSQVAATALVDLDELRLLAS